MVSKARGSRVSPVKCSPAKKHKWTFAEDRALLEFVGFARMDPEFWHEGEEIPEWPGFRQTHKFWTSAAKHIQLTTKSSVLLTSKYIFV